MPGKIIIDNSDHVFVSEQAGAIWDFAQTGSFFQEFSPEGEYIAGLSADKIFDLGSDPLTTVDADGVVYGISKSYESYPGGPLDEYQGTAVLRKSLSPSQVYPVIPLPLARKYCISNMVVDNKQKIVLLVVPIKPEKANSFGEDNVVTYSIGGGDDLTDECFFIKINEKGEIIWKKKVESKGSLSAFVLDKMGNIYRAGENDAHEGKIYKYSNEGVLLKTIDCKGSKLRIGDIAIDWKGNIYATDWSNNYIIKFDQEGNEITRWGKAGLGKGEFNRPMGIGVDSKGNVYVADTDNHRVQKFAPVQ